MRASAAGLMGFLALALLAAEAGANAPVVTSSVKPRKLVQSVSGGQRTYFADFGSAFFGSLSFRITASGASQTAQVAVSEAASATDLITNAVGARSTSANVALTAGAKDYTQFNNQPFKACRIRIPEASALDTASLALIAKHVPFDDAASDFSSSDTVLNRVWGYCKHSVKATTFLGVYIDGVRELKPYEGDTYVNLLSHYAFDPDPPIALFTHEYLLTHPTWPWEYRLIPILVGWEIYLATGDKDQLSRNYAALAGRIQSCIGSGSWSDSIALADWPVYMRDGYDSTRRGNVVTNSWVYKSLSTIADIADVLGKTSEATAYRTRAAQTRKRINDSLWMKDQGRYRDAMGTNHASLHGNAYPLALGVVPDSLKPAVGRYLASRGMACNVYAAQFLLDGLFDAGQDSAAIALMSAKTGNSWGHMLYEVGSSITMEVWDPSQKPNLDWNHAWATAPANVIPRKLFGILPLSPAYGRFQIKPRVGALSRGSYTLPTVKGPIRAAFESRKGQSLALTVSVPPGSSAKAYLPALGAAHNEVIVDGTKRAGIREGDFVAIDSLAPGEHALERSAAGTFLPRRAAGPEAGRVVIVSGAGAARFRLADASEGPARLEIRDGRGALARVIALEGAAERAVALPPGVYTATFVRAAGTSAPALFAVY